MVLSASELPPPKKEVWKDHKTHMWNLNLEFMVPLSKDRVFHIITDPDLSTRVFSNFQGYSNLDMIEEDRAKGFSKFELDRHQWYRILWFKGTISTRLLYENSREKSRQSFKLVKPGFMRVFDGSWDIEDAQCDGTECSRVKLNQLFQLGITIPGSDLLIKRLVPRTTDQMMKDLIREAELENEEPSSSDEK